MTQIRDAWIWSIGVDNETLRELRSLEALVLERTPADGRAGVQAAALSHVAAMQPSTFSGFDRRLLVRLTRELS